MFSDTQFSTSAAAEVAELRAAYDRGEALDAVAAAALLPFDQIEENSRRQLAALVAGNKIVPATLRDRLDRMNNAKALASAGYRRETTKWSAPTTPARPQATEAEAKHYLLDAIRAKHGEAAATAAANLPINKLIAKLAAPTRAAISASWDRAFAKRGLM